MDFRNIRGQRFSGLILLFMGMVRLPLKQLGSVTIIFEPNRACASWAHIHHLLSVHLSLDQKSLHQNLPYYVSLHSKKNFSQYVWFYWILMKDVQWWCPSVCLCQLVYAFLCQSQVAFFSTHMSSSKIFVAGTGSCSVWVSCKIKSHLSSAITPDV